MSDEKHLRTFTFLTYGEVQDNGWISAHVWKQLSLSCVFLECFGTWIQPAIPKPKIKKRSYQCPSIVCYLMLLIPNGKSTCKDCRRPSLSHKSFPRNAAIKENVDPQLRGKGKWEDQKLLILHFVWMNHTPISMAVRSDNFPFSWKTRDRHNLHLHGRVVF